MQPGCWDTMGCGQPHLALTAVLRLIRTVPTVILGVAFPPERDALVILADKLQWRDKLERVARNGEGGPQKTLPQGTLPRALISTLSLPRHP